MTSKLIVFVSSIMFLLLPWYYAESGLPQPVDVAIVFLIFTFFFMKLPNLKFIVYHAKIFNWVVVFSLYCIISLLINYILKADTITIGLLVINIYYILLMATFLLMVTYFYRTCTPTKFYHLILFFLLVDTILPLNSLIAMGSMNLRISLTFNNPNQLGFFVLVNLSVFVYASLLAKDQGVPLKKGLSLVIINLNLMFLFLASSRACAPVILLYVISYFTLFKLNLRGYKLWWFRMMSSLAAISGLTIVGHKLYLHLVETRASKIHAGFSSFFDDFYFRALHGLDLNSMGLMDFIFGNGLFSVQTRGHLEFHNNFIAVFSQSGLLGLLLYIYLNILIVKGLMRIGWVYLLPYLCYLFYSMFQYSYRTRMNWIFLAMVAFTIMYAEFAKRKSSYTLYNTQANGNA